MRNLLDLAGGWVGNEFADALLLSLAARRLFGVSCLVAVFEV